MSTATEKNNRKKASSDFQIFAKPTGSICNLDCHYCYYLEKENLYPKPSSHKMPEDLLELYIKQHIEASPEMQIDFSWHGGEPTLLGVEYFQKIVAIQKKYCPSGKTISNGMQTNGTLLNDEWCDLLKKENFAVGLSLDGPEPLHDIYRLTKGQGKTSEKVIRGYNLLCRHDIPVDILCVVNSQNVKHPLAVYRFFKSIGAEYISFLPLVERDENSKNGVNELSVSSDDYGKFLCVIFDEWLENDIGKIKIQIFEEITKPAFGLEHALCIFRETCGDIPVIEHNGDFYSCDHYVEPEFLVGNIANNSLAGLLNSKQQWKFGVDKQATLPKYCKECEVLEMCNGGCPKNRFINTPDGETGLNYLCAGYIKFFNHCTPFINEVSSAWSHGQELSPTAKKFATIPIIKIGRNKSCPCGSGKKYKQCCM